MWIWLLISYAVGVTIVLVLRHQRKEKEVGLAQSLMKALEAGPLSLDDLKVIAEVAKIKQQELPWYERSLSTLGVIAFFSMLIATGVQTMRTTLDQLEVGTLRQEMQLLQSQRSLMESVLPDLSRAFVVQYRASGYLQPEAQQVLRHRMNQIDRVGKAAKDDLLERFDIAVVLGDYKEAMASVRNNFDILDNADAGSLITLAEFSYLNDSPGLAKEYLQRAKSQIEKLPASWLFRVAVLDTILNPSEERTPYLVTLTQRFGTASEDLERRLEGEVRKLKSARERHTRGG